MFNTWKNENIYYTNVSGRYGNGVLGKDSFTFQTSRYSHRSGVIEEDDKLKKFEADYENVFKKIVEIKEEDVIYFFKESKYPRFKFSSNCKNNKTIQIEKATYLITPKINIFEKYSYYGKDGAVIECTLTNRLYILDKHYYQYINKAYTDNRTEVDKFIQLLQDKFIIQGNNYREVPIRAYTYNLNISPDFINNIYNNINKCISEDNLEKYVSKDSTELTKEMYDSINLMLKAKDAATVELGIKMLNNFNIEKYSLKIGSLLRLNQATISNNKAINTVGFKNILSQLGTDWNSIKFSDLLAHYSSLYNTSTSDDNKSEIQYVFKEELKNRMNEFYQQQIYGKVINTTLTLEII